MVAQSEVGHVEELPQPGVEVGGGLVDVVQDFGYGELDQAVAAGGAASLPLGHGAVIHRRAATG